MVIGRYWTIEEEEYLKEYWGKKSIFALMKKLDRSESALYTQTYKMGLGPFKENLAGVTVGELAAALNKSVNCVYNYINLYGLPYETIQSSSVKRIKYVNLDKWWKWLEKNHERVDFTLFERWSLGAEPEWVERQRAADQYDKYKKNKYKEWTSYEIATLKNMLSEFKYTTEEIAQELKRSPIAVLTKIKKLGILLRPIIKETKRAYWTAAEIDLLERLCDEDKPIKDIAKALNRSQGAVRNKIDRLKVSQEKERVRMLEKGEIVGYISKETCQKLDASKKALQKIDADMKKKISYYVSYGKTEGETNALIAEEFMETFGSEYEKYRKTEAEVRKLLNCSSDYLYHINFETGAVIKLKSEMIH